MSVPTNHWKVGLFVVSGVVLTLCALVYLGVESLRTEHVTYTTYFDEPVQGLDVGAPIEFRGVKVGQVAAIRIAPDRRHVEVSCALFSKNLRSLGLGSGRGDDTRMTVPADLRVQLAVQGLTGLKILQLDFFDVAVHPAPALPFRAPERYIPAAESTLKSLQTSVTGAVDRMPEIADALLAVATRADRLIAQFEDANLAAHASATLNRADLAFTTIHTAVNGVALGKISDQAERGLKSLDATILRANAVLTRLDGDHGVLASIQRTSNAFGDVAGPALGEELAATLRELQEAAASFRRLTDALERNPDMLLKGRGRSE